MQTADLFRVVDVSGYGRNSDEGKLLNSKFGKVLREGKLDLPVDSTLPQADQLGLMCVLAMQQLPYELT